ncbi:Phosphatidate phosphatase [Bertholletia excelsa]
MYAVGKLGSYISRGVYTVSGPFHPFSGAVDIIVVEQPDGSFKSSPWYVRFGKFQGVLKAKERVVNISVNGVQADFQMYLDRRGEAYFLREIEDGEEEGDSVIYLSSSGEESDMKPSKRRSINSKSCSYDIPNGKIVTRTSSKRSHILNLVFGSKSMKENSAQSQEDGSGVVRTDSMERAEIAANLLEVKWSTNLASGRSRKGKDYASRFSVKDLSYKDIKGDIDLSMKDENVNSLNHPTLCEQIGNNDSEIVNGPAFEFQKMGSSEQEASSLGESGLLDNRDSNSQTIAEFDESGVKNSCFELDACLKELDGQVSKEKEKESEAFAHCKASESLRGGLDDSYEKANKALYISCRGCMEVSLHAKSSHHEAELISEVTSVQETSLLVTKGASSDSVKNGIVNETYTQMVTVDTINCSVQEVQSCSVCTICGFNNLIGDVQVDKTCGNEDSNSQELRGNNASKESMTVSPSEGSKEQKILYGDLDGFNHRKVKCSVSVSSDHEEEENHPPKGSEEVKELLNQNEVSYLSEGQENVTNNVEDFRENSREVSNHIDNPRVSKIREDVGKMMESLPDRQSHSADLVVDDLCHSLEPDFKSLQGTQVNRDSSSGTESDADKDLLPQDKVEDGKMSEGLNYLQANPVVEVSLCKHLLFEGMGADAASQAFDAEKLDTKKFASLGPAVTKNDSLVVRIGGHYFSWNEAATIVLGMVSFGSEYRFEPKGKIPVERVKKNFGRSRSEAIDSSKGSWRVWPFSFKRARSLDAYQPAQNSSQILGAKSTLKSFAGMDGEEDGIKPKVKNKKVRTSTPTPEQLASLNLKKGKNIVTFMFSTKMLGPQKVEARIYLWKWDTRIVISDVDGTITKSDVLGQFMPLVGVDWSQTGVVPLFSAIKENGYQMLFLSARAISQAYLTRQFLFNLKQDGKALPDGPVVISPDGLFPSLFREVIRRAPHEFKIACLENIRALFPSDCNPFYAGFGNRNTDEISYLKVGIPKGKIFTINTKGEVAVNRCVNTRSYTSLHSLVHDMFPPMSSSEQEDFNSWNYWKLPPPIVDI